MICLTVSWQKQYVYSWHKDDNEDTVIKLGDKLCSMDGKKQNTFICFTSAYT